MRRIRTRADELHEQVAEHLQRLGGEVPAETLAVSLDEGPVHRECCPSCGRRVPAWALRVGIEGAPHSEACGACIELWARTGRASLAALAAQAGCPPERVERLRRSEDRLRGVSDAAAA